MRASPRRTSPPLKRVAAAALVTTLASSGTASVALGQDADRDRLVRVSATDPVMRNDSFVSPLAERFGDVRVGRGVFVAGNTILRADPGRRICIGSRTNAQDNTLILAIDRRAGVRGDCARRSTDVGRRTSIAHQAEIVNSEIGDFAFVGFRARISDSVIGDGTFVLHATTVRDVRIGRERLVPVGASITTQRQADALPRKAEAQAEFQREVLEVNAEFAEGYRELYERKGNDAVIGASEAPSTAFNRRARRPTVGRGFRREVFSRVVGDVRIGANGKVGRRTSIGPTRARRSSSATTPTSRIA